MNLRTNLEVDEAATLLCTVLKEVKLEHRVVLRGTEEKDGRMWYSCVVEVKHENAWLPVEDLASLLSYLRNRLPCGHEDDIG